MKLIRISVILSLLLILVGGYLYQHYQLKEVRLASENPRVWEPEITAFEQSDQQHSPPENAIVFIGSSAIAMWDKLSEDMQPLTAFGRGFGGAKIMDLSYFSDRIVKPYHPSAVVVYIGANDFSQRGGNKVKSLQEGRILYRVLIDRLQQAAPGKPIYLLALRPNPENTVLNDSITAFNHFLANEAQTDMLLHYVDANKVFFDRTGQLDDCYMIPGSPYINQRGYELWGRAIRQRLLADLGIN